MRLRVSDRIEKQMRKPNMLIRKTAPTVRRMEYHICIEKRKSQIKDAALEKALRCLKVGWERRLVCEKDAERADKK